MQSLQKVDFFFDLHAHPSLKRFFIYGNAFNDFSSQVEAQLFGKLVEQNCPYFENLDSIFTEKAMKAKDRFDNHTKEGCGRVYYHKRFKLLHSYTVECGYFYPHKLNSFQKCTSMAVPNEFGLTSDWEDCSLG
jgi:cytosolic carboxypeptidase protein 5